MLDLTMGGRCVGWMDALAFFESLPDMIPDEVKTETFCDTYEWALNRVRIGARYGAPAAPRISRGRRVVYNCGQCGAGVSLDRDKYCPTCGRPIDWGMREGRYKEYEEVGRGGA